MFRLPVCPYCKTVYSYKEVRNNKNEKIIECYHCKNNFRVSNIKGYAVLPLIVATVAVTLNLIVLNLTADFISSIFPLVIISLTAALVFILFSPFFSGYKRIKNIEVKEIPKETIEEVNTDKSRKQKRSVKTRQRKNK
jgi:NADH:ubiquinone oxidoreductase subunit K